MKNIKYILTFILFIFFTTSAYSQNKIASLDVVQLLRDSKAALNMKDQLNAVAKKYTEEDKKKQKEIAKSIKSIFSNLSIKENENKNMHDKTGRSTTYHYYFVFPNGDMINIQCYMFSEDFKKKNNLIDNLKVMMVTKIMDDHYHQAR